MAKATRAKPRKSRAEEVRVGRPPLELVHQVDERILEAARSVFLQKGLAGASIDEIATLARAGKPTIYARYSSKEDLFAAVVLRNAAKVTAKSTRFAPTGATIEERLVDLGKNILNQLLDRDTMAFMRLSVAETRRFPQLAKFGRMARDRGADATMRMLSEVAKSDDLAACAAFAPERLAATSQVFLDLVAARPLMRAIFGEKLSVVKADVEGHVRQGVAFFLSTCGTKIN